MLESVSKKYYKPLWVDINNTGNMIIYLLEVRDLITEDYKKNFINPINTLKVKISELRKI